MGVMTKLRADAARNRGKLLSAASREFGERGLDAPLEHIARRAGVSIGTLYAHFPTRDAFFDAVLPDRLSALTDIGAAALADPDPWHGFTSYLDGVFALQANDQGLNDLLAQRVPLTPELKKACATGLALARRVIARAQDAGCLRADFGPPDLLILHRAMSQVIRESPGTDTWRRCLTLFLEGLRTA